MIEPKDIEIDGKVFVLSKFNYEDGREIIHRNTQCPRFKLRAITHAIKKLLD